MKNKLIVAETFYSIQGEGQTMGVPAVFLRLGGCNLLCKSDSWICDSIEVWQKGTNIDFNNVLSAEHLMRLQEGAHLIITGGEPMLHQTKIIEYLDWLEVYYNLIPIVEIETNGTIVPVEKIKQHVNYWNCSPKLSSSGESHLKRFKVIALKEINSLPNSIFKFVISHESDVIEVLNEFAPHIDMKSACLMPAGENQKQLNDTRAMVVDNCIKLGIKYSERLHIVIWNKKTGV